MKFDDTLTIQNNEKNINGFVKNLSERAYSQRQVRVGELVKQNIGEIFIRGESKISSINTKKRKKRKK